jgi:hypothetical protein
MAARPGQALGPGLRRGDGLQRGATNNKTGRRRLGEEWLTTRV